VSSGVGVALLGTASPLPDPHRAGPATLVRAGDEHLLVDAGRGLLTRAVSDTSEPTTSELPTEDPP
jgi:ribonuclease Z